METLKAMNEHWPIGVRQHVRSNLNHVVGSKSNQVAIERRVVKIAERNTIGDLGFAQRIAVGHDVCGFEQLAASETTDCTVMLICA